MDAESLLYLLLSVIALSLTFMGGVAVGSFRKKRRLRELEDRLLALSHDDRRNAPADGLNRLEASVEALSTRVDQLANGRPSARKLLVSVPRCL